MNVESVPSAVLDSFLDFFVGLLSHPTMELVANAAALAMTVLAILLFVAVLLREIMTHWALTPSRRRRYLVRATGDGDWSLEDLERWAAQLSMVRRRVRRRLDRPAHAVRIRYETTPNGPRYSMECSWRFERVMLNPTLPGISITRMRPRPNGPQPSSGPPPPPRPQPPRGSQPPPRPRPSPTGGHVERGGTPVVGSRS
jgi:hypothetical protein